MKPAPFEYIRPSSIDEVCALLAADEDARLIAGGQTLVPLMAMRLARPSLLIDIARIAELSFVRDEGDEIAIGAATRQCLVEHDAIVRAKLPLLAKVMPYIGHSATRARGTIGGSLANADPAAELALVAVTLGATMTCRDWTDTRIMPASDFFVGAMETALPRTGCLVGVRFPVWRESRIGIGFHEVSARRSDFAFASAAAQIAFDDNNVCTRLSVAVGAIASVPKRLDAVEQALQGRHMAEDQIREAVEEAVAEIEPLSDPHASAEYRRRVAATLAVRAIMDAFGSVRDTHAR